MSNLKESVDKFINVFRSLGKRDWDNMTQQRIDKLEFYLKHTKNSRKRQEHLRAIKHLKRLL